MLGVNTMRCRRTRWHELLLSEANLLVMSTDACDALAIMNALSVAEE